MVTESGQYLLLSLPLPAQGCFERPLLSRIRCSLLSKAEQPVAAAVAAVAGQLEKAKNYDISPQFEERAHLPLLPFLLLSQSE